MTEPIRRNVDANGVNLNVYVLTGTGQDPNTTPVVMLHGMRDVGLSLMPIADELASQGTEQDTDGRIVWAFDPRVGSVFADPAAGDSDRYWPHVHCPTCIVSGALAAEYWGRAIPGRNEREGMFAPGELEARVASFPAAEHIVFNGSGHMVHFDEPDRLAAAVKSFVSRIV